MKTYCHFLCSILFFLPLMMFSQDGTFDPTFGDNGYILTNNDTTCSAYDLVQQTDEKLVVTAGEHWSQNEIPSLIRYHTDGTLDLTFGDNGSTLTGIGRGKVDLQSNEKIIVGGISEDTYVTRRYTDLGVLDTSFADNGTLEPIGNASLMTVLDDNNLLLIGLEIDGTDGSIILQKYLPNGAIDVNFGANGISSIPVLAEGLSLSRFMIQNDGSILVLLTRGHYNSPEVILIKVLATGFIDSSFGNNGFTIKNIPVTPGYGESISARGIDVAQNGNIFICGKSGTRQTGINPYLLRFLPNGQIDGSFGDNGFYYLPNNFRWPIPFQMIIQENGRILIAQIKDPYEPGYVFSISRHFPNGSIDPSFTLDELESDQIWGYGIIMQSDGKIVGFGRKLDTSCSMFIGRYNNNPLGVPEFETEEFTVFPNPSEGLFTLKSNSDFDSETTYVVTDISGKVIQKGVLQNSETTIDLSEAQNGMYFLKTTNNVIRLLKH